MRNVIRRASAAVIRRIPAALAVVFMLLFLAVVLSACSSRELFHPDPTGVAACGVITTYRADGTVEKTGRLCR